MQSAKFQTLFHSCGKSHEPTAPQHQPDDDLR